MTTAKAYYRLTKPGIIYGNAITAAGGFFLASKGHINLGLLVPTLLGVSLVIASACVFNNFIDRDIDKKMARTKKRALVSGIISDRNALTYAVVLGLAGFLVLYIKTNLLTVMIGLIGFFDYVILYGITKRRGPYGTLVGSISGAMPVVAGYVAVTNRFDLGALLLFLILVFWQMPHFYAIAMRRLDDYKAANIPVLPAKYGLPHTKFRILFYIIAFLLANIALTLVGYTGYVYATVMTLLGLIWLYKGIKGLHSSDSTLWARNMFLFSLVVILFFSIMLPVGALLP